MHYRYCKASIRWFKDVKYDIVIAFVRKYKKTKKRTKTKTMTQTKTTFQAKTNTKCFKKQHVLYLLKEAVSRISNMVCPHKKMPTQYFPLNISKHNFQPEIFPPKTFPTEILHPFSHLEHYHINSLGSIYVSTFLTPPLKTGISGHQHRAINFTR